MTTTEQFSLDMKVQILNDQAKTPIDNYDKY